MTSSSEIGKKVIVGSSNTLLVKLQPQDDEVATNQGRATTNWLLVSVVTAPAATLLAVAIVVASESLVASVLAVLVTLPSGLVARGTPKGAILASSLAAVKSMALLLNMCRIASISNWL